MDLNSIISKKNITGVIDRLVFAPVSIFPLITFRIVFGLLMFFGTARFMYNEQIEELFIYPKHHFKYYGFEWISSLGLDAMYGVHYLLLISAACITIGLLYRLAIVTFFFLFTYVELIDASNYLNHYYLVILLAMLLVFLPSNANFSFDAKLFPKIRKTKIPAYCINILIFQFCIVYFYAGFAKLNSDWLFRFMPMSIWLPERVDTPLLGYFFQCPLTAKLFSYFGALYDLTIWIFLLNKKTRNIAYFFVLVFHLMTYLLFNIGLFPFIMIFGTLIFFSNQWHEALYPSKCLLGNNRSFASRKWILIPLFIYICFQFLFPLRSYLYKGNVLWHEQAYRFSWRVMLVEKSGTAMFHLEDKVTARKVDISNNKYLTDFQEKQMTIQPDFILQYAKIIEEDYKEKYNIEKPIITADIFVALNKRTSSRFIRKDVNLLEVNDSFQKKDWILPMQ